VRAEDSNPAVRDFIDLVDKVRPLGAQPVDDVAVMDDLMADIDRRPIFFERALDDLDRSFHPRAETSWLG
jgi:hypothetical protein